MERAQQVLEVQRALYEGSFYRRNRWRWLFRADCRYRRHRLRALLREVGCPQDDGAVLDVGFGSGDLLFAFPPSWSLLGIELSRGAVEAIRGDRRLRTYRAAWFEVIGEDGTLPTPPRLADLAICSHVLEHVPDDEALLDALARLVRPRGWLALFVPIEPPGFDPKHVRRYDVASLTKLVRERGLEVVRAEGNYHWYWGPLRWMDHPARHSWPHLAWLEGVRNIGASLVPHSAIRACERLLARGGAPATQAFVLARKTA